MFPVPFMVHPVVLIATSQTRRAAGQSFPFSNIEGKSEKFQRFPVQGLPGVIRAAKPEVKSRYLMFASRIRAKLGHNHLQACEQSGNQTLRRPKY
jgi:hypothetical protein